MSATPTNALSSIRDQFIAAARSTHTPLIELPQDEGERIRAQVAWGFVQGWVNWIWQHLVDSVGVYQQHSWQWVDEYVNGAEAVMLFNRDEEGAVFVFPQGAAIVPVIEETYVPEFYLTNRAVEYLICYNHHEYLIASGSAKEWLLQLKQRLQHDPLLSP